MNSLIAEYLRPWKLLTLGIGVALLIWGSFVYQAPDWDIPISLIMAVLSYLTASLSMRIIVERRWRRFPIMLLFTWFTVDGCYWIYWHHKNHYVLDLMRKNNFFASLILYALSGFIWYYNGSIKQMIYELKILDRS
jgi:hypothetical protein